MSSYPSIFRVKQRFQALRVEDVAGELLPALEPRRNFRPGAVFILSGSGTSFKLGQGGKVRSLSKLCALAAALTLGATAAATGSQAAVRAERLQDGQDQPISTGFVFFNGEYLPPPYTVTQDGEDLLVNGRRVSAEWIQKTKSRGGLRQPSRHAGPANLAARTKRQLHEDSLLIFEEDEAASIVSTGPTLRVLDVLLSEQSDEAKVAALADVDLGWMNSERWARMVAAFRPTSELRERVTPRLERWRLALEKNTEAHEELMESQIFRSKPVTYSITVATMLLSVIATGRLLTYRPNTQARWREIDSEGEGVQVLLWNVVLVFLFGLLDLGLSLVAQHAGGFFELNPLGGRLLENPLLLTAFKLTSLTMACLILVGLRRYRGAQVASWWLCLMGAILTFRWLTYNSLFLS